MLRLGMAIYSWGMESQNRVLTECLGSTVWTLYESAQVRHFWFDRYDARGPHLFAVLSLEESRYSTLRDLLKARLDDYWEHHPSTVRLTADEITARHTACRGRCQNQADRLPGWAENNTCLLFEHPPRGFPFHLARDLPEEEALWSLVDEWTFWAVEQLASHETPTTQAVLWMARLDRALAAHGLAAQYWRYHAICDLPGLADHLAASEDGVLAALPSRVGERNRATFSRLWAENDRFEGSLPDAARWVRLAAPERAEGGRRWALLRELVHAGLKQLGLPVRLHIPLVLYAWSRHL